VSYEYRVFMVHQATESTFLHLSAEPLRDGVVIEVERPGSELDGRSVIVYSVLAHPLDGRPGIAYAREAPRLVAGQGWTEGQRVEAASLRKEPQCRSRIKAELRSQSRPTSRRSRRPEGREPCRTSRRQRPRLPTCPLIPTASKCKRRLTSRVAPSSRPKEGPCKRERRGLAS
jgi:hypothetical protein